MEHTKYTKISTIRKFPAIRYLADSVISRVLIFEYHNDCRTSGDYPGSFQRRRFSNEDIMVTLPEGVDACDIGTITVWCQPFRAIFTRLEIPRNVFVS